jgi:hypothetical protein
VKAEEFLILPGMPTTCQGNWDTVHKSIIKKHISNYKKVSYLGTHKAGHFCMDSTFKISDSMATAQVG